MCLFFRCICFFKSWLFSEAWLCYWFFVLRFRVYCFIDVNIDHFMKIDLAFVKLFNLSEKGLTNCWSKRTIITQLKILVLMRNLIVSWPGSRLLHTSKSLHFWTKIVRLFLFTNFFTNGIVFLDVVSPWANFIWKLGYLTFLNIFGD